MRLSTDDVLVSCAAARAVRGVWRSARRRRTLPTSSAISPNSAPRPRSPTIAAVFEKLLSDTFAEPFEPTASRCPSATSSPASWPQSRRKPGGVSIPSGTTRLDRASQGIHGGELPAHRGHDGRRRNSPDRVAGCARSTKSSTDSGGWRRSRWRRWRPANRPARRAELYSRRDEFLRLLRSVAEEELLHLELQPLAVRGLDGREPVFVDQHDLVLHPLLPGFLRDVLEDAFAELARIRRPVEARRFLLQQHAFTILVMIRFSLTRFPSSVLIGAGRPTRAGR